MFRVEVKDGEVCVAFNVAEDLVLHSDHVDWSMGHAWFVGSEVLVGEVGGCFEYMKV